jgi:2-methylcitrate dehydratase PrpD
MTAVPEGWDAWRERLVARIDGVDAATLLADDGLRRKAALVVMDDLAAMLVGATHPEVVELGRAFSSPSSPGEATTVLGGRGARDRTAALNAAACGWDELDEGYRPATCHGGLYTVPAAAAEGEATGRTVGDVLTAVVVGYEVVTAFARAFPAPKPLVLHPHATLSPIGAAAAVAWLRTGSGEAVMAAVDVAATLSMSGPFSHAVSGAQVRNAWAGAGAVLGFLAVDLAAAGLSGEPTGAVDVFASGYGQAADDAEIAGPDTPAPWAILDGYHKVYAACQYTHSALEASLELAHGELADVSSADIAEVVVQTHPLAYSLDNADPTTTLAGKFSLPHVVGAVLASGRTDPSVFDESLLHDQTVARLRGLVRIEAFDPLPEAPHDRPARVTVRRTDGSSSEVVVLSAVGGPDRPLEQQQVLDKIADLTAAAPGFAPLARALVAGRELDDRPWHDLVTEAWQR